MTDIKELQKRIQDLSILIVDDEADLLNGVEKFMKKFFNVVDTALNGEEALEKYKQGNYDVIITDIQMPKLSGDKLVKLIKETNKDIFIGVLTGNLDLDDNLKKLFDAVLVKPVDMPSLVKLLEKIIEKKGL
ncbi:MAG: response regulator [Halarcobacter sp.]